MLNSDPAINGTGTARANGYISTYFNPSGEDAKLAFSKKQVVFRAREEVGFSSLFFSTFFGGGSEDYASSANVYAYFKDFNVRSEGLLEGSFLTRTSFARRRFMPARGTRTLRAR